MQLLVMPGLLGCSAAEMLSAYKSIKGRQEAEDGMMRLDP